jgi:sulfoxide reductase heme-binding subunit YedZ
MLGLFVYFYVLLHFLAYGWLDMGLDLGDIVVDIPQRPFILVGFAALLLMTPLAITSTRGWVLRLGGAAWSRLHQLVYPVAILGVVHYWWLVKADVREPFFYAVLLVLLLAVRLAWRRTPARPIAKA